jgi:limonene 1,2-monooxygenase
MSRLKFGVQIFPMHRPIYDTTTQISQDLDLIVELDRLGFDEVWIGEHHSGGWEIIGSPELMIAAAAERTKHIRFGTGVNSLTYHHPLILTDRILQLDHMTRGRVIWGVGPGSLALDAKMMGYDPLETRRMMGESLDAIVELLKYEGPVNRKTDWFELVDAQLHLRPYSDALDIRVAASSSPSGPLLAGQYGTGMFSFAMAGTGGKSPLGNSWAIVEETAERYGQQVNRERWALMGAMHIAETEEQAREDVRWGLQEYVKYMKVISPYPVKSDLDDIDAVIDELNQGIMVIGTPEMAINHIERLLEQSGGAGSYVIGHIDIADMPQARRSYELFARDVVPHFSGSVQPRKAADMRERVADGRTSKALEAAQAKATAQYEAGRAASESPARN